MAQQRISTGRDDGDGMRRQSNQLRQPPQQRGERSSAGNGSGTKQRTQPQNVRRNQQGSKDYGKPMIAPVTKGDVKRSVAVGSVITLIIAIMLMLGSALFNASARNAALQATIDKANAIVEQAKSEVSLSPTDATVSKAISTNVNITVVKGAQSTTVNKPSVNDTAIGNNGTANNGGTTSDSSNTSNTNSNANANATSGDVSQNKGTNQQNTDSNTTNAISSPTGADTASQGTNTTNAEQNTSGVTTQGADNTQQNAETVHGAGIVVTSDGNIVTCLHVIENATSITAEIGGITYKATVTGTDPTSDIATIKVDAKDLPVTQFGDSNDVKQGNWAMVVGNPYGLNDTVTIGNVSAFGRDISYAGTTADILYADMIQLDASVNPGDSGGGVYDASGELIGMTALITTDNDNSVNIAYAIPSNLLVPIARNLVQGKSAQHAVLGASFGDVTQEMVSQYGLQSTDGAVITSVTPSGPADNVKLSVNDIIVKYDDAAVKNAQDLLFKVRASEVNQSVTLTVLRNGKEMTFSVKLGSDV